MQFLILVCLSFVALTSGQWLYPGLDLYTNGAITPHDEALHKANLAHYKALAEAGGVAAPVAVAAVHAPVAYAGWPAHVAGGLVYHFNGAVTPVEPLANQKARAEHFAAVVATHTVPAAHAVEKREAEEEAKPVLTYAGFPGYFGYPYAGFPYAYAAPHVYAIPFVHHPASGAIVPPEPVDVVEARAAHLKAHAEATAAALAA